MTPAPAPEGRAPLSGVRVLDLTTFLSGPFATEILGDLGADIIKLESPEGDPSRAIPPYFVGGDSAYYLAHNRNKRSIAVDLKTAPGLRVALDLVAASDVVIENFRPGVAARLGLDARALRAARPPLIWASISGFGQQGPWRDRPAYDIVVQALSGVMSLTGHPEGPPARLGIPAGDLVAGMYTAIATLAALYSREQTGTGATIDVSMLDGQLSMLSYQAVYAMVSGITPGPQGSRHDSIPTYRTFAAGDKRDVVVAANTERMWRGLCEVLGVAHLVADLRFRDGPSRLANETELAPLLEEAFKNRPAAEWADLLAAAGVPVAMVKNVPEALADARGSGRDMVVDLAGPDGTLVGTVGSPMLLDGVPRPHRYPPAFGGDTEAILAELGYTADRIEGLREAGIVFGR
jgi:CoA:oxalate CoA-transferase